LRGERNRNESVVKAESSKYNVRHDHETTHPDRC